MSLKGAGLASLFKPGERVEDRVKNLVVVLSAFSEEFSSSRSVLSVILSKRLYVGGLPYETTDDQLKELFSEAGSVESANIVTDKYSGRSRGFGFVEMSNDDEAMKAIESMNGKQVGERTITVNEAKPMGERRSGGFGGGFGGPRRGGFRRGGFGGRE